MMALRKKWLLSVLLLSQAVLISPMMAAAPRPSEQKVAPPVSVSPPSGASLPSPAKNFEAGQSFAPIVEKLFPGSVSIYATTVPDYPENDPDGSRDGSPFAQGSPFEDLLREFFNNHANRERRPQRALGSGFVIRVTDKELFIVTNFHVVRDAKKITTVLHEKIEATATIQGTDERTDIAVLKVSFADLPQDKVAKIRASVRAMEWGDSEALRTGDWVMAIGNPFGLGNTATFGPVSSMGRDLIFAERGNRRFSEYVDDYIQHQAPINMGNSGGMLANLAGKVIGINTAIFSPSGGNVGVGFAIPAKLAQKTVDQLIAFGRTRRGWIGVNIQHVTAEMSESLRLNELGIQERRGAIVAKVNEGGPANKAVQDDPALPVSPPSGQAGIIPGDIIFEYDGKPIDNEQNRLSRLVGETDVGREVKLRLIRARQIRSFVVKVGEFENAPKTERADDPRNTHGQAKKKNLEILGLSLIPIPEAKKDQMGIPKEKEGVFILNNRSEAALSKGDVIDSCTVNETRKIDSLEDFSKVIQEAKAAGQKNLLLFVLREHEGRYVTIDLNDEAAKPASPASQF